MSFHSDILNISKSFYARLFDTKSTGSVVSHLFLASIMEVLDSQERLDQPLCLDELNKALEFLEKDKTPSSDSLLAELYSVLWDLSAQDLLEVCDGVLLAGSVCKSTRKDIITLICKLMTQFELSQVFFI
eukprot:g46470.t1